MKIKVKKKKPLRQLKKELDRVFSLWIRDRDAHRCFTCDKVMSPKESQCGHFISRSHFNTRYSEINCHAQCVSCNVFKSGNMSEYAERLMNRYGPAIITKLNKEKRILKSWSPSELGQLIERYTLK